MQKKLPVVETFHSVQGEGTFTGTPMHFIRLAGCPLQRGGTCVNFDGRPFLCDTNVEKRMEFDEPEIIHFIEDSWEKRICITGGEPLIHDLTYLIEEARIRGIVAHLETSGCIQSYPINCWITCSPKSGFFARAVSDADEVKLLIEWETELLTILPRVELHPNVFVQPIWDADHEKFKLNLQKCLNVLRMQPWKWRLSTQVHKFLGLR
jgi:7-carboxy-7-deazaguanine synthase